MRQDRKSNQIKSNQTHISITHPQCLQCAKSTVSTAECQRQQFLVSQKQHQSWYCNSKINYSDCNKLSSMC